MKEECLICKAPLEYLEKDILMECEICHKKETSKTRCVNGHYVCNDCHTQGLDTIIGLCMDEQSRNPIDIIEKMMAMPFCHMHGPEHHVMVGSALLTAYKNAGGNIDLHSALIEILNRGMGRLEVHAAAKEIHSYLSLLPSILLKSTSALRWKSQKSSVTTPLKTISALANVVHSPWQTIDPNSSFWRRTCV